MLFFLGSSKRKWWGRDRNTQKKQAHELDNGMVPLPAKMCYMCDRCVLLTYLMEISAIGGVMASVLVLSAVDLGLSPSQVKPKII